VARLVGRLAAVDAVFTYRCDPDSAQQEGEVDVPYRDGLPASHQPDPALFVRLGRRELKIAVAARDALLRYRRGLATRAPGDLRQGGAVGRRLDKLSPGDRLSPARRRDWRGSRSWTWRIGWGGRVGRTGIGRGAGLVADILAVCAGVPIWTG